MEGVRGTGVGPTVTLVLMQACEEAENTGAQQQGNPSVQPETWEYSSADEPTACHHWHAAKQLHLQQDSPELPQATPGRVIVQKGQCGPATVCRCYAP
ncbi:hypothetical protein NDU88_002820 [Pleurodeles waltl]|uniref:Uncharacterized protein n=1 Tax=Pleurodeles waltl TaxID=8319 RepID=A0AAV7Q7U4_PLEWA|nr:hypothetical protein NDU88_002820 [Pleurodeles waltl]